MSILYMFWATMVPIIRRNNCISATPGICYSVWMTIWYAGWDPIHTEWQIPGVALIQLFLLMMGTIVARNM